LVSDNNKFPIIEAGKFFNGFRGPKDRGDDDSFLHLSFTLLVAFELINNRAILRAKMVAIGC
jgi:hypothetical protein